MDNHQLKKDGLAFGKMFQRAFRVASLYTAEHAAAEDASQGAYEALGALLKSLEQFSFGLHNKRVALNNLVVADASFGSLEDEFGKRGFVAITFSRGIAYREFKRGLAALIAKPDVIEQAGGANACLQQIPIQGMRVIEAGGHSLGMDLQSYLAAKNTLDAQAGGLSPGLSSLLQSAGVAKPASAPGSPAELMALISTAVEMALAGSGGNLRELSQALARSLEELPPEHLLPVVPAERQAALKGLPPAEFAAELAEDMAVGWVQRCWTASGEGNDHAAAEQEMLRVLRRALETAQSSERLVQKLDQLFHSAGFPAEVSEWTRSEMLWASWTTEQKQSHLNGLQRFSGQDVGHLAEHIRELAKIGRLSQATDAAIHFLDTAAAAEPQERGACMVRVSELIRTFSELGSLEFARAVVARFIEKLGEPSRSGEEHREIAGCLSAAAQALATREDYEGALRIGHELERCLRPDVERHARCCAPALQELLAPATIESLMNLCVYRRPEIKKERAAMSLLKLVESPAAELVFRMLEEEKSAITRSRLLQIARQIGRGGIVAACKRLEDERWYVVRNACYILGALDDPDLPEHLSPVLRHSEARVQEAALKAILRSKARGRGPVLAGSLAALPPHLQESVLDELLLLKDAGAVAALQEFLAAAAAKAALLEKAVKALAAMEEEEAALALYGLLREGALPGPLRGAALSALKNSPAPSARQRFSELQQPAPGVPSVPNN